MTQCDLSVPRQSVTLKMKGFQESEAKKIVVEVVFQVPKLQGSPGFGMVWGCSKKGDARISYDKLSIIDKK